MMIKYNKGFFDTDEMVLLDYNSEQPEDGIMILLDRSVVPGTTALTESILNNCQKLVFAGPEAVSVAAQLKRAMDGQ